MPAPWIDIDIDKPRKLRLQILQARNACVESGKTVVQLLQDHMGGWPYLLKHGLAWEDKKLSLDGATQLMQTWIDNGHDLDDLGLLLLAALRNSGVLPKDTTADADPNVQTTDAAAS